MIVLKNADFGVILQSAKRLVLKEKQTQLRFCVFTFDFQREIFFVNCS